MKKSLFIIAIAASLGATGCAAGYVDEQPADVTYEQGVAPGPDYIWIDGDWVYERRKIHLAKGTLGSWPGRPYLCQRQLGAYFPRLPLEQRSLELIFRTGVDPLNYLSPERHQRELYQLEMLSGERYPNDRDTKQKGKHQMHHRGVQSAAKQPDNITKKT